MWFHNNVLYKIVFVCKSHYIDCLNSPVNSTYALTLLTIGEILDNHRSVLCTFRISTEDEGLDLLSLKLDTEISYASLQTGLDHRIVIMLHTTSFQINKVYAISGRNRSSDLLWHHQLTGRWESDVNFDIFCSWLVAEFFSRQSALLWVSTVTPLPHASSFICMKQISYRGSFWNNR